MAAHINKSNITSEDFYPLPEREYKELPEVQKRFWQGEPVAGEKVLHWGIRGHEMPPEYHTYGVASGKEPIRAKELVNPEPISNFANLLEQRKEAGYKDAAHVPLGKATSRNYKWPEATLRPDFAFGATVPPSEPAKEVISPMPEPDDTQEVHDQYARIFKDYAPGEQMSRNYRWKGMGDPKTAVFGHKPMPKALLSGQQVKDLVSPAPETTPDTQTILVPTVVDDHEQVKRAPVGRTMPTRARPQNIPRDRAFGYTPPNDGETVGTLIPHKYMGPDSDAPDFDLGHSIVRGRFGQTTVRDYTRDADRRTGGVPSIRTDIPAPATKSVANVKNYGEDPGSKTLIAPLPWAEMGISETDYLQPIEREKLHSLVMTPSNPFNLTEREFDFLCDLAMSVSTETIEAEFQAAKVNSPMFSSTDKSARLVKHLKEMDEPYLSIDGFVRAYEKYEDERVRGEVNTEVDREISDGLATAHMTMRSKPASQMNTVLLNDYALEAIEMGRKRADVPLAFGQRPSQPDKT